MSYAVLFVGINFENSCVASIDVNKNSSIRVKSSCCCFIVGGWKSLRDVFMVTLDKILDHV